MSTKVISVVVVVLMLTAATSTYASNIVGDFESGLDGWQPQDSSITLGMLGTSTTGATLHGYSLSLDSPGGFRWAIRCPLQTDPNIIVANNHVSFDVTLIASEWAGQTWAKFDKIAISGQGMGWRESTLATVEPPLQAGDPITWNCAANQTVKITWDYSAINFSSLPKQPTYLNFLICVNSDGAAGGGPLYFDNVVFFNSKFANNPKPPNTQTGVSVDVDLSWTAGDSATKHDVFFGTTLKDVNEAKNTDPMGPTKVYRATLTAGNEQYNIPEILGLGTTYYWRIDEDGVKGEVWSFTTQSKAKGPSPANGAIGVKRQSLVLSWKPGFPGALHDVYFGKSLEAVKNANNNDPMGSAQVYRARQIADANSYTIPEILGIGQTYYWRIDEIKGTTVYRGDVWMFTTFNAIAVDPSPPDDANDMQRNPTLRWKPGLYANTHNVYFGTDFNEVNNVNSTNVASYPSVTLTNVPVNSYEPGLLRAETTYYWRVDEVNAAHADKLWKGIVWNFTTGDYLSVDDMESYGDANTPGQAGSRIWYVWNDGYGWTNPAPGNHGNGTAAMVDLGTTIVRNGRQSLRCDYVNDSPFFNIFGEVKTPHYSELKRTFVTPQNWTAEGTRVLTLWFYGDPGNSAERLYVAVQDNLGVTGEVVYPQANALLEATWHEWTINLQEFTQAEVNLTSVKTMYIGMGNRIAPQAGGKGTLYFDDIRLYWPRCRPELVSIVGDFDADCRVSYTDLALFAGSWLEADETIKFAPNEMKKPATPILWYKFDETTGTTVRDYAGNYQGTVMNPGDNTWDTTGGRDGKGCINLAAGSQTFVEVPPATLNFASTTQKITFAAWIYGDRENPQDNWNGLFGIRAADADPVQDGTEVVEVHCPTPPTDTLAPRVGWRVNGDLFCSSDTLRTTDFAGRWNHYVFTKDASAKTISIYHNGRLVVEVVDVNSAADPMFKTPVGWFAVGARHVWWGRYIGRIDDFQVYNYVLSPQEIAWLATDGAGSLYVPLETPINLYNVAPNIVNFKDFAVFAGNWLEEKLWP